MLAESLTVFSYCVLLHHKNPVSKNAKIMRKISEEINSFPSCTKKKKKFLVEKEKVGNREIVYGLWYGICFSSH